LVGENKRYEVGTLSTEQRNFCRFILHPFFVLLTNDRRFRLPTAAHRPPAIDHRPLLLLTESLPVTTIEWTSQLLMIRENESEIYNRDRYASKDEKLA
jgi:hypothetical protein